MAAYGRFELLLKLFLLAGKQVDALKAKIRISVSARRIEIQAQRFKPPLKPVLEVKLFVAAAFADNQFSAPDHLNAFLEDA